MNNSKKNLENGFGAQGAGWFDLTISAQRQKTQKDFKKLSGLDKFKSGVERINQVTKGLGKSEHGKILMTKHWLEATDPKHRYGNGLIVYFDYWNKSNTDQAFFHWLDNGDGKDLDLEEFPKAKRDESVVTYLDKDQRVGYEVEITDGKFKYKQSQKLINTVDEIDGNDEKGKFIFVVSTEGIMYAGPKIRGHFHHSSFLSGGPTIGAGNLQIEDGILTNIKPHSGHYMPTAEEFQILLDFFKQKGIDMNNVSIGQIKKPKDKKQKEKKHPNLQTQEYKKLSELLTKCSKQQSILQINQLIKSLEPFALEEHDHSDQEVNTQNNQQNQNQNQNQQQQQQQQNQGEQQFNIPEQFIVQENLPVFLKKGYSENSEVYQERVFNFLSLLSRQELVYIISKVDPSQQQMQAFSKLVHKVIKQQIQQQQL